MIVIHFLTVLVTVFLGGMSILVQATSMFTTCSTAVTPATFSPTQNDTYEAIECIFGQAFVQITASALTSSTATTTFIVFGGTVASDTRAGIGLVGHSSQASALNKGPIHMTLSGVSFGRNAVLTFTGALPAYSSVTLTNNTFEQYIRNSNGLTTNQVAILIGDDSGSMSLSNSSSITVTNNRLVNDINTLTAESLNDVSVVRLQPQRVTLSANSTINISNNLVKNANVDGRTVLYCVLWAADTATTVLTVSGGSSFVADGNAIQTSSAAFYWVVVWSGTSGGAMTVSDNSSVSMSGNGLYDVKPAANHFYTVLLDFSPQDLRITALNCSTIAIDGNSMSGVKGTSYLYVVMLQGTTGLTISLANNSMMSFTGNSAVSTTVSDDHLHIVDIRSKLLKFDIRGRSQLQFNNNYVIACSATQYIYTLAPSSDANGFSINVVDHSLFELSGNEIRNSTSTDLIVVQFKPFAAIISDCSAIVMGSNEVTAVIASNSIYVISWIFQGTGTPFTVSGQSSIRVLHTTVSDSTVKGATSMYGVAFSAASLVLAGNSTFQITNTAIERTSAHIIWAVNCNLQTGLPMINSTLSIANTTLSNCSSTSSSYAIYVGLLVSAVLRNSSRLVVDGVTVARCNATELWAFYLYSSGIVQLHNRSAIQVQAASVLNVNAKMSAGIFLWSIGSVQLLSASEIVLARNELILTSNGTQHSLLSVVIASSASITASGGSGLYFVGNFVSLTRIPKNSVVSIPTRLDLTNSSLAFDSNIVHVDSASLAISILLLSVLGSSSSVLFVDNTFELTNTSQGAICPPLAFDWPGTLGGGSLIVSGNNMTQKSNSSIAMNCPSLLLPISTGLDRISITDNQVTSSGASYIQFASVRIATGGQLNISGNQMLHRNPSPLSGQLVRLAGAINMSVSAIIFIHSNSISGPSAIPRYLFLNASSPLLFLSPSSWISLCRNVLFGDVSSTYLPDRLLDRYLSPLYFARFARGCTSNTDTKSSTVGVTSTNTHSLSPTYTRTASSSISLSWTRHSLSPTYTQTESSSISLSWTRSNSLTLTKNFSRVSPSIEFSESSTEHLSASNTLATSASASIAQSASSPPTSSESQLASESQFASESISKWSQKPSISLSVTCRELDGLSVNDTCEVLRPLPFIPTQSAVALDKSWRTGVGDCTQITVPYSTWTGRQGAVHTIAIAAVDFRVPLKPSLLEVPPIVIGTAPINPVSQTPGYLTIILLNGTDESTTDRFPYAYAVLSYTGRPTLNRIKYQLDCKAWTRCPISMPGVMDVTLEGSERLLPTPVADAVATGTAIVSIGAGLTVSPTAVAQLGVATSLRQMSRCVDMELVQVGDDSYADYVHAPLNPFGIQIGKVGGGRTFVRGSLLMSAVYLVCLSCLMLLYTTACVWLKRYVLRGPRQHASTSLMTGYPSSLVAAVSFAMDGAAGSGTVLGAFGYDWQDRLLGWIAVLVCVLYVAHILFVTTRGFPSLLRPADTMPDRKELERGLSDEEEEKRVRKSTPILQRITQWMFVPTNEWVIASKRLHGSDDVATLWMARYESYIADVRVPWYCGLEQGLALVICILSSLSIGNLSFCIARGVISVVLVGGFASVMVMLRPPILRWRWLLLSAVYTLQTLTAILAAANAPLQQQTIELGMDGLGTATFILLAIAFIVDTVSLLMELYGSLRHGLRRTKRRTNRATADIIQLSDQQQQMMEPMLSVNKALSAITVTPVESVSLAPRAGRPIALNQREPLGSLDLENDESAVVRAILLQFDEYELAASQSSFLFSPSMRSENL